MSVTKSGGLKGREKEEWNDTFNCDKFNLALGFRLSSPEMKLVASGENHWE